MPQLPNLTGPAVPPEQAAGIRVGVPSTSGLQAIAQAVGSVGEEMHAAKMKILEKQNSIDVLKNESAYGQHMANEQQKLDINNPASWPDQVKKASSDFVNGLSSKNLSPDALESLKMRIMNYESKVMLNVARDARLAQVQIISGEFQNRQNVFFDNKDFAGAKENLKESASLSKMPNHEVEAGLMKIQQEQTKAEYDDQAASGNAEYFEHERQGLSKSDRLRYKQSAKSNRARMENESLEKIYEKIELSQIKTKKDLESALNGDPRISEASAVKMLNNWDKNTPISFAEKKKHLDTLNDLFKAYKDGKISKDVYAEAHHNASSKIYAMSNRPGTGGLRQRAYALDPTKWTNGLPSSSSRTQKDIEIESMVKSFVSYGGMGEVPSREDNSVKPIRKTIKKAEIEYIRERVEQDVKEWASRPENENATREEKAEKIVEFTELNYVEDVFEKKEIIRSYEDIISPDSSTKGILPKR